MTDGVTVHRGRPRAIVAAVALAACGPAPHGADAAMRADGLVVVRGDLEEHLLLTGEIDAESTAEFTTPRTDSWQIAIKWMVTDGSLVAAGDKVVEFDNTSVLERQGELELKLTEAEVDLDAQAAKNTVDLEDRRFAVHTAEVELAKATLDASVPEALLSRREAQDVRIAVARAEVALASARADLRAASAGGQLQLDVQRIAVDKARRDYDRAQDQLDAMVLSAPAAGIFVVADHPWEGRKLQVADNVWPGFLIGKLPDSQRSMVKAKLSDADEGKLMPQMLATCTVDAYPDRPIAGSIAGINPVAHADAEQSLRRFFDVAVTLKQPQTDLLRPGMSVKVDVVIRSATDVLLVPRALVDFATDQPHVRLADGTSVVVEIEFCDARTCVVNSGLTAGDRLGPPEVWS